MSARLEDTGAQICGERLVIAANESGEARPGLHRCKRRACLHSPSQTCLPIRPVPHTAASYTRLDCTTCTVVARGGARGTERCAAASHRNRGTHMPRAP